MKLKLNYIIIPLITVFIDLIGKYFTDPKMIWYASLQKPSYTPPNIAFPIAWTAIYILTTICVLIVWNTFERTKTFYIIISLFIMNALLNALWTPIFFYYHLIFFAGIIALALAINIALLIYFISRVSIWISVLLIPYAAWVVFATILNFHIWILN